MTTTRTLCALNCGWHHDQADPVVDPALAHILIAPTDIADALLTSHLQRVEAILRAHLETHELIEWVQALQVTKQQLAEEKSRQEEYEESVVGALNERNTRDCKRAEKAEATLAAIREYLETSDNNGIRTREHLLGVLDQAGVPSVVAAELEELPELTAEDAVEAMQDMAGDLYRAEDRLAFVREMCDLADRNGQQVTTEQARAWTNYTGCGGAIVLPHDDQERLKTAIERPERELTLAQAMAFHRLTGRIIDQAQRERWTAAGRCGTCGFDGDRTNCQDCSERSASAPQAGPSS